MCTTGSEVERTVTLSTMLVYFLSWDSRRTKHLSNIESIKTHVTLFESIFVRSFGYTILLRSFQRDLRASLGVTAKNNFFFTSGKGANLFTKEGRHFLISL